MRIACRIITLAVFALAFGCSKKDRDDEDGGGDGSPSDRSRLQGDWVVENVESADRFASPCAEGAELKFEGEKVSVSGWKALSGSYFVALVPWKSPRQMTLTRNKPTSPGPDTRSTTSTGSTSTRSTAAARSDRTAVDRGEQWIYKLEDKTLTVALRSGPGARPGEFKTQRWTPDGAPVSVVRLKKKEPRPSTGASTKPPRDNDPPPVIKEKIESPRPTDDRTAVQGRWRITRIELPTDLAAAMPNVNELTRDIEIMVQGETLTASKPGQSKPGRATFRLDPARSPRQVDITELTDTGGARERIQGIYKFEGGELVVALATENVSRPSAFYPSGSKAAKGGVIVVHLRKS